MLLVEFLSISVPLPLNELFKKQLKKLQKERVYVIC